MAVTSHQQASSQLLSRDEHQNSPFSKPPQEVRDVIYDLVFTDDSEIKLPHPLMQTSKALRQETTAAFACNFGPRATLYMACITHHRRRRTGPMLIIQGTDATSRQRRYSIGNISYGGSFVEVNLLCRCCLGCAT